MEQTVNSQFEYWLKSLYCEKDNSFIKLFNSLKFAIETESEKGDRRDVYRRIYSSTDYPNSYNIEALTGVGQVFGVTLIESPDWDVIHQDLAIKLCQKVEEMLCEPSGNCGRRKRTRKLLYENDYLK